MAEMEFRKVFNAVIVLGKHKKGETLLRPGGRRVIHQFQKTKGNHRLCTGTGKKKNQAYQKAQ
jgi:hypothetical protein